MLTIKAAAKTNSLIVLMSLTLGVSLLVIMSLMVSVTNEQIFWVRLQQVFGFVAFGYWYLLLLLGALARQGIAKELRSYSWILGVSTLYIATIHAYLGVFDRFGGLDNLSLLPTTFKQALLAASFVYIFIVVYQLYVLTRKHLGDSKIVRKLFAVLGNIAAVLLIVHIWLIGTHITYTLVQVVVVGALAALVFLKSLSWGKTLATRFNHNEWFVGAVIVFVFASAMIVLSAVPEKLTNYGQTHVHDENAEIDQGHHH